MYPDGTRTHFAGNPLFIIGLNVLIHDGALGIFGGDFKHASALAFGIGAYMMLMGAFQVLIVEQKAMWLLYTFPKPLHSLLLPKTFLCLRQTVVALEQNAKIVGGQWIVRINGHGGLTVLQHSHEKSSRCRRNGHLRVIVAASRDS